MLGETWMRSIGNYFKLRLFLHQKKKVSFLSRGIPLSNRYLFLYKKTNFKVISFIKLLEKSLKKLPLISPGVNVSGSVAENMISWANPYNISKRFLIFRIRCSANHISSMQLKQLNVGEQGLTILQITYFYDSEYIDMAVLFLYYYHINFRFLVSLQQANIFNNTSSFYLCHTQNLGSRHNVTST